MKTKFTFLIIFIGAVFCNNLIHAQATNVKFTNAKALDILQGNYNPQDYTQTAPITDPLVIFDAIIDQVNADSLKSYLEVLSSFENRNTGSDTLSDVRGIGAAQRWCLRKMNDFSLRNEERMENGYLVFDQFICGMGRHKDVVGILPGVGENNTEVIVVEAHLDSRCENNCDIDCLAEGMEDNGSGSALVLELARVLSQYSFDKTIVFMLTTGEEQGLHGARAFADYCRINDVDIIAAYNNDIVGGIICGKTASPPGCPFLNHIDSTNVRVYSQGGTGSKNKMLARFLEIQYERQMVPKMSYSNVINIMSPEDRTGRGGDHIPFRENGYPTVRFSSANENGDGNPSQQGYCDHQHTKRDILGVDTDNDNVLDSFFVDFNYLARNTIINAGSIASTAFGPQPVSDFSLEALPGAFVLNIDDPTNANNYLVGVRRIAKNTFDTIYFTNNQVDTFPIEVPHIYYVNVAVIDDHENISRFCLDRDVRIRTTSTLDIPVSSYIELLQNYPNPFDEATTIAVVVNRRVNYKKAEIRVYEKTGKIIATLPIDLKQGINEVMYGYDHHNFRPGTYLYGLWVDDVHVVTKSMIYAF